MGRVQYQGGNGWSSVAPRITFEKKAMVAISKLVQNLEGRREDDHRGTGSRGLQGRNTDKETEGPGLGHKLEVASWRYLVRVFPAQTREHREYSSALRSQSRQKIVGLELLAGGFPETAENSRTSR